MQRAVELSTITIALCQLRVLLFVYKGLTNDLESSSLVSPI